MKQSPGSPPKAKPQGIPQMILDRVGFLLNKSAQKIREITEESLKPFGLAGRHLGVLATLQERGSLTQHEIGKCMRIDRTTMVQVVDDLEKLSLVERKDDPADRRAYALFLTPKGREVLPQAMQLGLSVERKFLSCLTLKDRKDLIRILKKLVLVHHPSSES